MLPLFGVLVFGIVFFVPFIPISTSYPPFLVLRDWTCGACPAVMSSHALVSVSYVVSDTNLGVIEYPGQAFFALCRPQLPFAPVTENPCLVWQF